MKNNIKFYSTNTSSNKIATTSFTTGDTDGLDEIRFNLNATQTDLAKIKSTDTDSDFHVAIIEATNPQTPTAYHFLTYATLEIGGKTVNGILMFELQGSTPINFKIVWSDTEFDNDTYGHIKKGWNMTSFKSASGKKLYIMAADLISHYLTQVEGLNAMFGTYSKTHSANWKLKVEYNTKTTYTGSVTESDYGNYLFVNTKNDLSVLKSKLSTLTFQPNEYVIVAGASNVAAGNADFLLVVMRDGVTPDADGNVHGSVPGIFIGTINMQSGEQGGSDLISLYNEADPSFEATSYTTKFQGSNSVAEICAAFAQMGYNICTESAKINFVKNAVKDYVSVVPFNTESVDTSMDIVFNDRTSMKNVSTVRQFEVK